MDGLKIMAKTKKYQTKVVYEDDNKYNIKVSNLCLGIALFHKIQLSYNLSAIFINTLALK